MSRHSRTGFLSFVLVMATSWTAGLALVRADRGSLAGTGPPDLLATKNQTKVARPTARVLKPPDRPLLRSGAYTIRSAALAFPCRPFASVNADCNDNLIDTWFTQDDSGRQVFIIQNVPSLTNVNLYTIAVSGGRSGCERNLWSMQSCAGTNYPDLYSGNDGSGRQLFSIIGATEDQFYIIASTRYGSCASFLSAAGLAGCSSSDPTLHFVADDDGSSLQRWILTPTTPPAGSEIPIGASPLPSGTYNLYSEGTTTDLFNGPPYANVNSKCSDPSIFGGFDEQVFKLQLLPRSDDTYTISTTLTTAGRAACGISYWSMQGCDGSVPSVNNFAFLVAIDDSSDLQHWRIVPAPFNAELGLYYLIGVGRSTCPYYLSLPDYYNPVKNAQFGGPRFGGPPGDVFSTERVLWQINARPEVAPILQSGNYRIAVNGRYSCDRYLLGPDCDIIYSQPYEAPVHPSFGSGSDPQGVWKVTLVEGLNIYTIVNIYRQTCDAVGGVLNSYDCESARGLENIVDFIGADNGIFGDELERWELSCSRSTGPSTCFLYNIQNAGRTTCRNYLSVQECGGLGYPDEFFFNDGSGRQEWEFIPA